MEISPAELGRALEQAVGSEPSGQLADATARLINRYQQDTPAAPGTPIVDDEQAATAYALYRMPATYAAARAALRQAAIALPGFNPARHCDLGGGTGGVAWAVADTWSSVGEHRVIEQSPAMIKIGRRLARATSGALARTTWTRSLLTGELELSRPDLLTLGYVLGELDHRLRRAVITAMTAAADTIVIIEPGTKAGYRRILEARDELINAGFRIAAPCPHDRGCPLAGGDDWCHFAVRVNRSATHRMIKNAELSYEDEKFSYLVATLRPVEPAPARIVRRPAYAKGQVILTLCQRLPGIERTAITKRDKADYRAARSASWGDPW